MITDIRHIVAAAGLMLAVVGCAATQATAPNERIFVGSIYTGVEASPRAEAVAVRDGRILAVGEESLVLAAAPSAEIVELGDAVLYPGFTDAHMHLMGVGLREITLNLEGVASISELQDAVRGGVEEVEAGLPVFGRGWIETHWPEDRFPTRHDLDPVSGEVPVVLMRADGHALVANSAALDAAGVTAETPDPDGGQILRDESGEATGMLIDKAMVLVADFMGDLTGEARDVALETGAQVMASAGWSGAHAMSFAQEDVARLGQLAEEDRLAIRVYTAVDVVGGDDLLAQGVHSHISGLVVNRAVKIYMDGALGSRGAALLEPYEDADGAGLLLSEHDEVLAQFEAGLRDGVQMNVHAIGDRANRLALDWMEEAFAAVPPEERLVAEPRWRIEHAQIIDPDDIPRFAELGVIASMQPSHAIGDLHFAPDRLGLDRLEGAYAWRSLIDSGAVVVGGSDAPVERGEPLIEFYAAVARRDLQGFQGEGWHPEEAVTREEALAMFTAWPAYASFQEDQLGTIEIGKRADFSVFSGDLMEVPAADIPGLHAVMTVVDGEIVFDGR